MGDLGVAMVLGSSTGGIGRHVRSLVRGLTSRGVRVHVFGPAATESLFDFSGAGALVTSLEIPANPSRRDVRLVSALRAALRTHARTPLIVHAHGLRAGLVAALARPTSLVVTWHNRILDGGMRGRVLGLAERIVARAADITLGASDDLVARALALGGTDVRLAPVAAPLRGRPTRRAGEVRAELGAGERPLVLSVGRLHPQKGYHTLVAASARWRGLSPVPLVAIAGTGPAYRELAGQILAERAPVQLLGHRDDVTDLLGAASLAVVTSVWEARQLFAQEALAAGAALVATDVGGLPGLVGDAAVLVAPGDVDALDAAVRRLLADDALRAHYARAARRRAAQLPGENATIEQAWAVYAELGERMSALRR